MCEAKDLTQKSKRELIDDLLLLQIENENINAKLKQRTNEFLAVNKVNSILGKSDVSFDSILQELVEFISTVWQFPAISCARIVFDEHEYKTSNFKTTKWKLAEIIHAKKIANAIIEVYYLVEKPEAGEGPFIKEERNLLKIFAENLSRFIERNYLMHELEDYAEKYAESYQKSPIAKCLVDKSDNFKFLDVNNAFLNLTGFSREELVNCCLIDIDFISKELVKSVLIPMMKQNKSIKDFEITVQDRQGESKTGLINIATIFLKSKEVILVAINNISEQKKAQNKILESENRFQNIFDSMQDAYFHTDLDGNIAYFNSMALKMYGCDSANELLGKHISMLYANAKEREVLHEILRAKGKAIDYTCTGIRKDGTSFDASINARPCYDNNGNIDGYQAVVRDTTDRATYERKILESEKRFRDIFENMPSGYVLLEIIYDEKGQPVNHRVLEANAQFDKQTGLKRKELIGKKMKDRPFSLPADVAKKYYEVAITGKPFSYERFNETLNRYYDIRVSSPKKGQFSLLFNDITQRKIADQKIMELLNRFKQIAKHLPGFIYQYHLRNDNTSHFPYVSDNVFGVTPEKAFENAQHVFNIILPEDLDIVIESIKESAQNMTLWNESFRVIVPTGETIWVEGKSTPTKMDDGSVLWHGFIQDISERKRQEQELLRNRKLLKRSQRAGKIGSWEFNLEKSIMVFEEETYEIFGFCYDDKELNYEMFLNNIIHPDDLEHAVGIRKQIQKEKHFIDHEYRIIRKEGETRHILVMGDIDLNPEGNVDRTYGIIQDITERKEREQELVKAKEQAEKNEGRLNAFKSSSTEAIFFLKNDIVTDANETACKMFGYTLEELIGMSAVELTAEESRESVKNSIKKGSEKAYDAIALRKDESNFYCEVRAKMFDYYGEKIRVTALRDISERKEREQELLIKQKLLLESQRIANVGSWDMDLSSFEINWSQELYQIYGFKATGKKPVVSDFYKLIHPDDNFKAQNSLDTIFKKKEFENFECRIITALGETKYIFVSAEVICDKTNKPTHLFGIVQDRTHQKKYEEDLIRAREKAEENEKKLINAQELAKLGSWELDYSSKTIKLTDSLFKLLHTSKEQIGSNEVPLEFYLEEFVHPDDNGLVTMEIEKAHTTDDPNFTNYLEYRNKYYDGGVGYIGVRYFVIKDDKGKTVKMFGVNQDITEKKNKEIELIKAKEIAEKSDRLKTAFLLNVSHEIRTPMNGILGFTELLRDPDLSEDDKSSFIRIINKSGERLLNTINDIVEISKIEIGDIEIHYSKVDLTEMMQYHYDFFCPEIREKGLEFEVKNEVPELIETDKHKLDGILMNLLKNAIKFTNKGKIEFGNYISGNTICFFVSDTGIGIPKDRQGIIFNRFVQADTGLTRSYEGSGIGLAIVKSYVDALNGTIKVESELDEGSTFTVSIPFREEKRTNKNSVKQGENVEANKKPTILIAEDDDVNFFFLKKILSNNFEIIHARNGEQAVRLFSENPDISAVLMDIKMPGEYDGLEAIRRIKRINKNIIIIAQTAFARNVDKKEAFDAGCNEYITKPFKGKELLSIFQKLLNQ